MSTNIIKALIKAAFVIATIFVVSIICEYAELITGIESVYFLFGGVFVMIFAREIIDLGEKGN